MNKTKNKTKLNDRLELSFSEYRDIDAINNSSLQSLRKSYNQYIFDSMVQRKESEAFKFGRAYHKFILESEDFFNEYAVAPECDRRTKLGKETWAKFHEDNASKEVLAANDFNTISRMRAALMDNATAQELIINSQKELSTVGELYGTTCKARADMVLDNNLIDLKTTLDCSKKGFIKSCFQYGYFRQAAFYCDLFGVDNFIFICQEKQRPHDFNIFQLEQSEIELGRQEYKAYLKFLKKNHKQNKRVDYYSKNIEMLEVPGWIHVATHDMLEKYTIEGE